MNDVNVKKYWAYFTIIGEVGVIGIMTGMETGVHVAEETKQSAHSGIWLRSPRRKSCLIIRAFSEFHTSEMLASLMFPNTMVL